MAETLSPTQRQRTLMSSRLQSPTSPFFLGSNDDNLERAQVRAARAAAVRRKQLAAAAAPPLASGPCLDKEQIIELFQNCIKLASENKINQKNTWELNLIDHLSDIIKVEEEDDVETNFQKASCTLEAGVKIYSMRVDSVHSEAYKVLGGINRVGQENGQDHMPEDANIDSALEDLKKERERKVSPLSTLESSFEALNVKKFDVAFAVDPLYHQTSAQFDEGGAKGLLLNNLGVYGNCRVLFDSMEFPGKCMSCSNQHEKSDTIDISFAKEHIEQMVLNMGSKEEISPTLKDIVDQFDETNRRPSESPYSGLKPADPIFEASEHSDNFEMDGDAFDNFGTWAFDHDNQTGVAGEDTYDGAPHIPSYHQESEPFAFPEKDTDDRFEKVDGYLLLSLGFTSKQNSWAGPDHWKYQKTKANTIENASMLTTKKPRNKKQEEVDVDFTKALNNEILDVFAPPKNPKSLLLSANRPPCNITLPEDCHYQPENLVKLFLLPNVMCLGRRGRNSSGEWNQHRDDYGPSSMWDDGSVFDATYDDGNFHSDVDDSDALVSQPRQVNKIEVKYDKTSKQVDVQALKETLWDHLRESTQTSIQQEEAASFKQILASFPNDCRAAATVQDLSPHLCFICLLHLANEHGLVLRGCAKLDDIGIQIPEQEA